MDQQLRKSSLDTTCDTLLRQERIARFAPEKQFSTTFRHGEQKLKLFHAIPVHQVFRHVIYISLTCSALASLILLLIGILHDHRTCLTAGCILGLACFGAMLHGCLRHRSLPNTPTPLVLSAAYMCPVGNLPIGTNPETTAAATAMATATLLPKTIHSNSSLIASSLEVAMLTHLRRDVSVAIPPGIHWPSIYSGQGQLVFGDTPGETRYKRQLSDSIAYTHSSGARGEFACSTSGIQPQLSCPPCVGQIAKPHVYENLIYNSGWNSAETASKHSIGKDREARLKSSKRDSVQSVPESCSTVQGQKSGPAIKPWTPQPGTAEFYKEPVFPQPQLVPCTTGLRAGSSLNECPSNEKERKDSTLCCTPAIPQLPTSSHEPIHVRLISPTKSHIRTPRSVIEGVHQEGRLDSNVSTGLWRLLSHSSTTSYDGMRQSRRHTREREGIFGPKIWRAWRSWMD